MVNARVTIVSTSRVFRRRITLAIASTGAAVHHCGMHRSDIEQETLLQDIYIVDADGDGDQVREAVKAIDSRGEDAHTLVVAHRMDNGLMSELLTDYDLNVFIGKHGDLQTGEEIVDLDELIVTCNKLYSRDIFGIEKYVPTWGTELHHEVIWDKDDKIAALNALQDFLGRIDCHRGICPVVMTVADELLMNGIYNAPRDEHGVSKYTELSRQQPLVLEPNECVDFRYICTGRQLVLSVSDRFGSLDRGVLTKYLTRGIEGQLVELEQRKHGAGLGLHFVYNSTTQLVFNIQPGLRTEVIATFYVRGGTREFRESGRSLGIFLMQ